VDHEESTIARQRLEQASRLSFSVLELVRGWRIGHAGDELVRRQIALSAMTLAAINRELLALLRRKRLVIEAKRCPHCGWFKPPMSAPHCPRCGGLREVHREAGRRSDRQASRA
jgi:ribosomal protein S27AE